MKITYLCYILCEMMMAVYCVQNNVCLRYEDYQNIGTNPNCWYDIAADSNTTTVIEYYGYPSETHKVVTDDGYILTVFRVPNINFNGTKKEPVLLVHALDTSSLIYFGLRKNSLGFLLADAGYDVWLINFRGNEYSKEHVNLTVDNPEYWDFCVDDLSLSDIPATLKYISDKTNQGGNIIYIGHSLGTTTGFMYTSWYPEEAKKYIKIFFALAPAPSLINTKAPLVRIFGPITRQIIGREVRKNFYVRTYTSKFLRVLTAILCNLSPAVMKGCIDITNLSLLGPQSQAEPSTVPTMFHINSAGTSPRVVIQEGDLLKTKLRKYDYGSQNMEKYGTPTAPLYNVTKIEVPIFMIYSVSDWTNTKKDALIFYNSLQPKAQYGSYEINLPNFNHGDFVFGKDAKKVLYDVVFNELKNFK